MLENYSIKTLESIENEKWDQFVFDHPKGNIFQTSYMAEVYEKTKNYEPISLAVVNSDDRILSILQAVVINEMGGAFRSLSTHSRINGGPISSVEDEGGDAVSVLMKYYDKIVQNKAIYSEIRNLFDTSHISNTLLNSGYVYEDHLNYLVDLTVSKTELWTRVTKSGRRNIKKAKKNGLTIKEIKDRNLVPTFYDLLLSTYKIAKMPLADISFFNSIFDIFVPKHMVKFLLIQHADTYIGGVMVLIYKGRIYEWYKCSNKDFLKLYPNEIATWYPIKWGSENGCDTYDFLGAGKPEEDYGVREYKSKFGGELINFGRYKKIHSKNKMKISENGFKIYTKFKFW